MLPHAHYLPSIRFAPRCEDSTSAKLLYMPISLHVKRTHDLQCYGRVRFENVSIGRRPNRCENGCATAWAKLQCVSQANDTIKSRACGTNVAPARGTRPVPIHFDGWSSSSISYYESMIDSSVKLVKARCSMRKATRRQYECHAAVQRDEKTRVTLPPLIRKKKKSQRTRHIYARARSHLDNAQHT
ncbi:hypothetical protein BGY98DRAFT_959831 [Russula aff. rugulosa BPL654]|nr:hypothetical protein BGY98DRAFT_959831 [Russula aff. rugulosa BPL654]